MEGPEGRGPGYDDWFDQPAPPTEGARPRRSVDDGADEGWVLPEADRPRRGDSRRGGVVVAGRTLTETQLAILAASAIAVILAILAAAGVFSSGKPSTQPVTTPTLPAHTGATTTATVTKPAAQAPSTTLKPGDTGKQVKTLQKALTALGFSTGKADGDYGPTTQNAVEQFQTSKGLTADGIVGQKTLAALQKALSG